MVYLDQVKLALDTALSDQVKSLFDSMVDNTMDREGPPPDKVFARGLRIALNVHSRALEIARGTTEKKENTQDV